MREKKKNVHRRGWQEDGLGEKLGTLVVENVYGEGALYDWNSIINNCIIVHLTVIQFKKFFLKNHFAISATIQLCGHMPMVWMADKVKETTDSIVAYCPCSPLASMLDFNQNSLKVKRFPIQIHRPSGKLCRVYLSAYVHNLNLGLRACDLSRTIKKPTAFVCICIWLVAKLNEENLLSTG